MTVEMLLLVLEARGVQFDAVGDRLRFRPREAVPAALRRALVHHKAAVLAHLRAAAPTLPLNLPPRLRYVPARGQDLWPRDLPGLGPRRLDTYTRCAGCGGPTSVYYGDRPHCRQCAERARRDGPAFLDDARE